MSSPNDPSVRRGEFGDPRSASNDPALDTPLVDLPAEAGDERFSDGSAADVTDRQVAYDAGSRPVPGQPSGARESVRHEVLTEHRQDFERPGRDLPPNDTAVNDTSVKDTRDSRSGDGSSMLLPPTARNQSVDGGQLREDYYGSPEAAPTLDQRPVATPVVVPPDRETLAAREREQFGGMQMGAGFFGWLTATGMAVLLLAIVAAAGVAFGVTTSEKVDQAVQESQNATGTAQTVGLVGAILLGVILFVAYFCGGYVAGRMARFSGPKQGVAVWLWAIVTTAILAAIAAIAGSKYNVLAQLNLPRIPVDEGSVTTVGLIAIGGAILVAFIGAVLGGLTGTRYHRRVDALRFQE